MILKLENIAISYTDSWGKVSNLLHDVNIEVAENEVTALIGGNGTGKTTLFNIISGFQRPTTGRVWYRGRNVTGFPPHRLASFNGNGIGRLFQGLQLMENLTLAENMILGSDNHIGENPWQSIFMRRKFHSYDASKKEQAVAILEQMFGRGNKYVDLMDSPVGRFSYGEQRLIALARLLMGKANLLLLDEPTSGVNMVYIDSIKAIVTEMANTKKRSVFLIEHNMDFVRSVSSRCVFLDAGTIACHGATEEVLNNSHVRKSYLGI